MERLKKFLSKDFGPVILAGEHLDEIWEVLAAGQNPSIVSDEVKYEDVDELIAHTKGMLPIDTELRGENPLVRVELRRYEARLTVLSDGLQPAGVFASVSEILSRCERRPRAAYRGGTIALCMFLISGLGMSLQYLTASKYVAAPIAAEILLLVWLTFVSYISIRRHSLVIPLRKTGPTSNFWARNKDTIIVGIICAFFGALISRAAEPIVTLISSLFH